MRNVCLTLAPWDYLARLARLFFSPFSTLFLLLEVTMQSTSLFLEGINLLTLGMGFVFIFLIFLVYATRAMSQLIVRFAPPEVPAKTTNKKASANKAKANPNQNQGELLAVLTAAVHHHKTQQKLS
ncbi:OadG family protein [Vibrio cholerae]|uniref:OadG family protein n=1 Tax=Vibrio cholerae TaxID=666 RepID=UPI0005B4FE23|nr:OadG family protein [Vibrio cholerae]EHD7112046.1 sodium pump decarboxylase [Vibrio cholerae]EIB4931691.1 OadG family protein [Vibrio cholerae]EJE4211399.1 OadG family protein [Vibrio cholerae]EJL6609259.1 OadG family protein [Vibrio cholerae]EJL6712220.1 OadG family protein [Vibrio cholerae]